MKPAAIEAAVREAKHFLEAAQKVEFMKNDDNWRYVVSGPKETGSLRRASMELTRALAEMRRP